MWITNIQFREGASTYLVDDYQGDCRETNLKASEKSHGAQCYSSNVGAMGPRQQKATIVLSCHSMIKTRERPSSICFCNRG